MLFLILDVAHDPFQILRPETHDPIAGLPFQGFTIRNFVIDVMRACAFQFADPVADEQCRRNAEGQMDMIFCPANRVKNHALRFHDAMLQIMVDAVFDGVGQGRIAGFGMPGEVQIDFRINVTGLS